MAKNLIKERHVDAIKKRLLRWVNDANRAFDLYGVNASMFNVSVIKDRDDENAYYIVIHTSEDDTDSIIIKEDIRDDSAEE